MEGLVYVHVLRPRAVESPLMALNWGSDLILFTLIKDLALGVEIIGWDKSGSWKIRRLLLLFREIYW